MQVKVRGAVFNKNNVIGVIMTDEDLQTLENLLRMALANVCVNEPEDAIQLLAEAHKLVWQYL